MSTHLLFIAESTSDSSKCEQRNFSFIFVQICFQQLLVEIQCVEKNWKVSTGSGTAVTATEASLSSIQFFNLFWSSESQTHRDSPPRHCGQMTKMLFLCPDAPTHLCLQTQMTVQVACWGWLARVGVCGLPCSLSISSSLKHHLCSFFYCWFVPSLPQALKQLTFSKVNESVKRVLKGGTLKGHAPVMTCDILGWGQVGKVFTSRINLMEMSHFSNLTSAASYF